MDTCLVPIERRACGFEQALTGDAGLPAPPFVQYYQQRVDDQPSTPRSALSPFLIARIAAQHIRGHAHQGNRFHSRSPLSARETCRCSRWRGRGLVKRASCICRSRRPVWRPRSSSGSTAICRGFALRQNPCAIDDTIGCCTYRPQQHRRFRGQRSKRVAPPMSETSAGRRRSYQLYWSVSQR